MNVKFFQTLAYYREKSSFSKTELTTRIGVKPEYIIGLEKGRVRAPTEARLSQISKALNLSVIEEENLFKLAFDERVGERLSPGFQKFLKQEGHKVLENVSQVHAPMLDLEALLSQTYKEGEMFQVQWGGHSVGMFSKGDVITIQTTNKFIRIGWYVVADHRRLNIVKLTEKMKTPIKALVLKVEKDL